MMIGCSEQKILHIESSIVHNEFSDSINKDNIAQFFLFYFN